MILETFNRELYEKNLKAEAYEEGYKVGYKMGLIEVKLAKGKTPAQIAEELKESEETILDLMEKMKAYAHEDGVEEGIEKRIQEADKLELLSQIERKLAKGKTPEQIAEELEESVETILELMQELMQELK